MRITLLLIAGALACSGGRATEPVVATGTDAVRADGIVYAAQTAVLESFPVQLRTTVSLTNTANVPVTLTFPDGCIVLLRAYTAAAAERPVWDQGELMGCTMALVDVRLEPGQTQLFQASTDAREILGTRLPDGRYLLRAYLRPNGRLVEVPAGEVDLAIAR